MPMTRFSNWRTAGPEQRRQGWVPAVAPRAMLDGPNSLAAGRARLPRPAEALRLGSDERAERLDVRLELVHELHPADVVVARVRQRRAVVDVDRGEHLGDGLDHRARGREAQPLRELVIRALVVARELRGGRVL